MFLCEMMQLPHQPLCTSILHRLLSFLFLCCPSASKKQADEPLINLPLHIELFVYDACLEWLGFWSPVSYQLKKRLKFQHYLTNYSFMIHTSTIAEKKIVRYLYEEYRHIISILEYICLDKYTYFCTFSYAVNLKF